MPQFFGYIRPSPTDVKGSWVLVFFQAHVLAYEVGTRKLTICRSPDFEMDVRYKPGIEGVNKTHLGFVLKSKDRQICLVKLAFNPNGQLSNAARDFSLQVKNWLKQHPVLGRRIESRLKQVASVREQMRAKGRRN